MNSFKILRFSRLWQSTEAFMQWAYLIFVELRSTDKTLVKECHECANVTVASCHLLALTTFCYQVKQICFRWPRQSLCESGSSSTQAFYALCYRIYGNPWVVHVNFCALLLRIFTVMDGSSCEYEQNMEARSGSGRYAWVGIVVFIFAEPGPSLDNSPLKHAAQQ
jgi:hypothetical protein